MTMENAMMLIGFAVTLISFGYMIGRKKKPPSPKVCGYLLTNNWATVYR